MLRKFFIILLLFCGLLVAQGAQASTQMGVEALRAGDFRTAYSNLQPAAAAGDSIAQFSMCGMYFLAQGVPKSDVEAFRWCKLAAEQGHLEAMYNLGLFYQKGTGVGQNYNEAIRWYQAAAERGHKDAQFNLLQLYNSNRMSTVGKAAQKPVGVVPQVASVAAPAVAIAQVAPQAVQAVPQMALQAAPQAAPAKTVPQPQQPQAQPQQPSQVQGSFKAGCAEAAQRGIFADNCAQANNLQPSRAALTQNTKAEIAPKVDPEKTIGWFEKQAELGDLAAQNNLGVMYRRGMGVAKQPEKALSLFEKSAARGSTNGMLNLANMYKLGEGTEQNLELSYAWYNLAADRLVAGEAKKAALSNIKEISAHLTNEQIGSALEYVTKLDTTIPLEK